MLDTHAPTVHMAETMRVVRQSRRRTVGWRQVGLETEVDEVGLLLVPGDGVVVEVERISAPVPSTVRVTRDPTVARYPGDRGGRPRILWLDPHHAGEGISRSAERARASIESPPTGRSWSGRRSPASSSASAIWEHAPREPDPRQAPRPRDDRRIEEARSRLKGGEEAWR